MTLVQAMPSKKYSKNQKNSDAQNNCCNYPKIGLIKYRVMGPKGAVEWQTV